MASGRLENEYQRTPYDLFYAPPLSHAGMDIRTLTRWASGEPAEQGVIDCRPVVALGWGFEATIQTPGCGELWRRTRHAWAFSIETHIRSPGRTRGGGTVMQALLGGS